MGNDKKDIFDKLSRKRHLRKVKRQIQKKKRSIIT
jgi:hypothetical protein